MLTKQQPMSKLNEVPCCSIRRTRWPTVNAKPLGSPLVKREPCGGKQVKSELRRVRASESRIHRHASMEKRACSRDYRCLWWFARFRGLHGYMRGSSLTERAVNGPHAFIRLLVHF